MINLNEIIVTVKLTNGKVGLSAMRAMVTLNFGGVFKLRGFRILTSKHPETSTEGIWVTPPSYLSKGSYHPIFFSEDKSWWKQLEAKIIDSYQAACIDETLKHVREDS